MATGDNMMDLAMKITADPSQAQEAIAEVGASVKGFATQSADAAEAAAAASKGLGKNFRTLAEAIQAQHRNADNAAEAYANWGVSAKEAAAEITAAFHTCDEELKKSIGYWYDDADAIKEYTGAAKEAAQVQTKAAQDTAVQVAESAQKEVAAQKEEADQAERTAQAVKSLYAGIAESSGSAAAGTRKVAAAQSEANATAQAMSRTIAQSLAEQGASAEEAAQIYKQMGISGQQAGKEISAAFGGAAAAAQAAGEQGAAGGKKMAGGIRESLGSLRTLRVLMYSTFGLISFGFYIQEWGRVAGGIAEAAQALGGFDEAEREVMQAAVAANEKQIESYGQLNAAQQIELNLIDDIHARRVAELKFEIANAKASEQIFEQQRKDLSGQIVGYNALIRAMVQMGFLPGTAAKAWVELKEWIDGTGKALVKAQSDEKKSGLAILRLEGQLKDAETAWEKAATQRSTTAQKMLGDEQSLQARGLALELKYGSEWQKQQTKLAEGTAKLRQEALLGHLKDIEQFDRQAQVAEARQEREQARQESLNMRQAEQRMRQHAQTVRELQSAMAAHGEFAGANLNPLEQTYSQYSRSLMQAGEAAGTAVQPISRLQFEVLKVEAAFQKSGASAQAFAHAMGSNIGLAIVYGDSVGKAMEKAVKATIAGIAAQALTWGLYYTAMGIADIFWNPPRAAADFAAAAEFFAVGGAAAAIGAAIPGGGGGHAAASAGRGAAVPARGPLGGSPGIVRGEGLPAGGGSGHAPNVNINLYGGQITDTHNLQNLVDALNQGGKGGTVRLNIAGGSHTIPNPVY